MNSSSSGLLSLVSIGESLVTPNNEAWYGDFVNPIIDRLLRDEKTVMVKLGPLKISKVKKCGYTYLYLGDKSREAEQGATLMSPEFVRRFLLL